MKSDDGLTETRTQVTGIRTPGDNHLHYKTDAAMKVMVKCSIFNEHVPFVNDVGVRRHETPPLWMYHTTVLIYYGSGTHAPYAL